MEKGVEFTVLFWGLYIVREVSKEELLLGKRIFLSDKNKVIIPNEFGNDKHYPCRTVTSFSADDNLSDFHYKAISVGV